MKILLVPGNNALSHAAKCLALSASLAARDHEVVIAAGRKNARFLEERGISCRVLPDIQEIDDAGFPTVAWFMKPKRIAECIRAEADLVRRTAPDRVVGVFRFTSKAAARLAGVPFDSLTCGCMLPDSPDVLGFAPGEPGIDLQRYYLDSFFRYAGARMSAALGSLGLAGISDVREMLLGDRTFLWDFPEFSPRPPSPGIAHVGPFFWDGWPYDRLDLDGIAGGPSPLALVTFGTCTPGAAVAARVVRVLLGQGYRVLLGAGGSEDLMSLMRGEPRVTALRFAPLHRLYPHVRLVVCHGGQMTVFEALSRRVPVLVIPFQPEQAHNALCLERLGCGGRLVAPQPFRGNPGVYLEAFGRRSDAEVSADIAARADHPRTGGRLEAVGKILGRYDGVAGLTSRIEAG
jgi:UDP:flavonoid glycosyltransferase YjiC (YdhE family)